MVVGHGVQKKQNTVMWLLEWKYQPGLGFGPVFTVKKLEEISTPLARSTRISRRGLPGKGSWPWKIWLVKGYPFVVIQPGLESNPGSCKEGLICTASILWYQNCCISRVLLFFFQLEKSFEKQNWFANYTKCIVRLSFNLTHQ